MIVLPFLYIGAVGAGFFASYIAVVQQIGEVSSGGYFLIFWMFQNPPDLLYSLIKAMAMAIVIVIVATYYGYTARGGPVGWAPPPRSRWSSTPWRCTWSGCSARRSSGGQSARAYRGLSSPSQRGTPVTPGAYANLPTNARPGAPCATRFAHIEEETVGNVHLLVAAKAPRRALRRRRVGGGPRLLTLGQLEVLRDDLAEQVGRGAPRHWPTERSREEEEQPPPTDRGDAARPRELTAGYGCPMRTWASPASTSGTSALAGACSAC